MSTWQEDGQEYGVLGEVFRCIKCDTPYYRLSDDCLCANCRIRMENRRKTWRKKQEKK